MPKKFLSTALIFSALFFVTVGDQFLPQPFNTYSYKTRQSINNIILGLAPNKEPKKPSAQREKQMDSFINHAQPSK
ncbi:MAG: hypothetical protein Cpurp_06945 [Chlorogloea purpurea SAG 13.99]|nr:hypothetical protein [Chlorogloea purpurea SAG 13.99]